MIFGDYSHNPLEPVAPFFLRPSSHIWIVTRRATLCLSSAYLLVVSAFSNSAFTHFSIAR
jgi:hypothetical protein